VAKSGSSPRPSDPGIRGDLILVIDDEAIVRRLVRRVLEREGVSVLEAEDGEQGLRMVQEHARELTLVITDLVMPTIDGFEVAEVLSIFQPDLPVLAMSGHATVPGPDRRLDVIKKPFSVSSLVDAVRAVKGRPHGPLSQEQRARAQELRRMTSALPHPATSPAQSIDLVAAAFELRRLRNQP
jgi:DNA-binding NtrC family response regulator